MQTSKDFAILVRNLGGTLIEEAEAKGAKEGLIFASEEDFGEWQAAVKRKKGVKVLKVDQLLQAALKLERPA